MAAHRGTCLTPTGVGHRRRRCQTSQCKVTAIDTDPPSNSLRHHSARKSSNQKDGLPSSVPATQAELNEKSVAGARRGRVTRQSSLSGTRLSSWEERCRKPVCRLGAGGSIYRIAACCSFRHGKVAQSPKFQSKFCILLATNNKTSSLLFFWGGGGGGVIQTICNWWASP